jgi:hypothetical protein
VQYDYMLGRWVDLVGQKHEHEHEQQWWKRPPSWWQWTHQQWEQYPEWYQQQLWQQGYPQQQGYGQYPQQQGYGQYPYYPPQHPQQQYPGYRWVPGYGGQLGRWERAHTPHASVVRR